VLDPERTISCIIEGCQEVSDVRCVIEKGRKSASSTLYKASTPYTILNLIKHVNDSI
jgi:hypothetical protein